jgi:hypothetical protein
MKTHLKAYCLLLIILSLSACSFAPLTSSKSARTLGKGNWEIDTGASPLLNAAVNRGMSDDWDFGLTVEQQFGPVFALTSKNGLYNNQGNGLSLSLLSSIYVATGVVTGKGFYVGPIVSYQGQKWEFFSSLRYNWLKWDGSDLSPDDRTDLIISVLNFDDVSINYLQYHFGFNYWFNQKFAWGLDGKYLSFFGSNVKSSSKLIPGTSLIWRF